MSDNDPRQPSEDPGTGANAEPKLSRVGRILVAQVRASMKDHAELNRLTAGVRNSNERIVLAISRAVTEFNATPPLIRKRTLDNFPDVDLLIVGAMYKLLEADVQLQTVNQMNYTDGRGVSVGLSDKAPQMAAIMQGLQASWNARMSKLKVALNIQDALGVDRSAGTEYGIISGLYEDI